MAWEICPRDHLLAGFISGNGAALLFFNRCDGAALSLLPLCCRGGVPSVRFTNHRGGHAWPSRPGQLRAHEDQRDHPAARTATTSHAARRTLLTCPGAAAADTRDEAESLMVELGVAAARPSGPGRGRLRRPADPRADRGAATTACRAG